MRLFLFLNVESKITHPGFSLFVVFTSCILYSLLLNFTLAELLETKKVEFQDVSKLFEDLLTVLEGEYTEMNTRFDKERTDLMDQLTKNDILEDVVDEDEGERRERERVLIRDHEREVYTRVEKTRLARIKSFKEGISLVWIVYMRLTRRSQSIRAARVIFSRARKSALVTFHVFVASALMEFYVNKDPVVAGKIFEVGLKTFPVSSTVEEDGGDGVLYILKYIDFLMCLNDDNSTFCRFIDLYI